MDRNSMHSFKQSTVMDILLRYALSEGLNVVLPENPTPGALYFSKPFEESVDYGYPSWHQELKDSSLYHIFMMHTRFNVKAIKLSSIIYASTCHMVLTYILCDATT